MLFTIVLCPIECNHRFFGEKLVFYLLCYTRGQHISRVDTTRRKARPGISHQCGELPGLAFQASGDAVEYDAGDRASCRSTTRTMPGPWFMVELRVLFPWFFELTTLLLGTA